MARFGDRLRREREMRGITLEEISEATKISSRWLRALETEEFDKLPGGIFNKGFVRAYARYLGIDEDQSVSDYLDVLKDSHPALYDLSVNGPNLEIPEATEKEMNAGNRAKAAFVVASGLVLVAVMAYAAWRIYPGPEARPGAPRVGGERISEEQRKENSQEPKAAIVTQTDTQQPAIVPASNIASMRSTESRERSTEKPRADGFTVLVKVKKDAWVSITADERQLVEGTLDANWERLVRAREKVVFRTGNAGGIELSYNGRALPRLGAEYEARTVVFTPEGVQQ